MPFNKIEDILEDFKQGKIVIITDDESRENEGDLIFAAEKVTPEKINFLAKFGRGLICVPMSDEKIDQFGLRDMVERNEESFKTAFTVSVDAAHGITTGISAFDRARTVEVLADPSSKKDDLATPGHIFPLRSKKGGVLIRSGHTEAATDLARLSGFNEAAVICEIMNEDGSMARTPELVQFAKEHNLKMGTIASLIQYRSKHDKLIEKISEGYVATPYGDFKAIRYQSLTDNRVHFAFQKGEVSQEDALVRVDSGFWSGKITDFFKAEHPSSMLAALEIMKKERNGILVYIHKGEQELEATKKLENYPPEDENQIKTNLREYGMGAQILVDLGVKKFRLVTGSPRKIVGLEGYGLEVIERIPFQKESNPKEVLNET